MYLKITIDGASAEISLKRSINEKLWDTARNHAKGSTDEAQQLNDYLNSVRGQIYTYHKRMQESERVITARILCNAFLKNT